MRKVFDRIMQFTSDPAVMKRIIIESGSDALLERTKKMNFITPIKVLIAAYRKFKSVMSTETHEYPEPFAERLTSQHTPPKVQKKDNTKLLSSINQRDSSSHHPTSGSKSTVCIPMQFDG